MLGTETGGPTSIRRADSASATTPSEELLHKSAGTVRRSSAVQGFLVCVSRSLLSGPLGL